MNRLIKEINDAVVKSGSLSIWWLGQEGYVIKSSDLVIYIDPYLSTYAERITLGKPNEHVRMMQAPIRPEEVTNADLVICTHNHADHIDPEGIPIISRSSTKTKFIVPECARQTLLEFDISEKRIYTLKGDDALTISGITIAAVPAKHEQFDKDEIMGYPYLSYVIKIDGLNLLHAGDTIPYVGQIEKFRPHEIDLAFVPINGRDKFRHDLEFEGNFNCTEAVDFAHGITARLTVPMHYNMFSINTGNVEEFRRIALEKKLNFLVMEPSIPMVIKKK
ncbi:MAG: MBL fold metallo-hydrolase [Bacteroidales bacterium]|nr:MBL fold metallo-hydrolase [Bacteroidales bacterium]